MAYEVVDGGKAVRCLQCGLVSTDTADVAGLRCPLCRMSHDEYARLGLEADRPRVAFVSGEKVVRHGCAYEVLSNAGFYGAVLDSEGGTVFPFYWFHDGAWCRRTS